jgi:CPA1 family monovalent cation:H+ antiporter
MTLFESTLVLLGVAVVLLRLAGQLRVPYPAMLALAGGGVAAVPWMPHFGIEPHLALALFVAPAVMDTAFDMSPRELRRLWMPLTSLAVILVLVTTAAVACVGVRFAGLPLAAAVALGAIVAPPDAAAAAAVLQEFNLPRRAVTVLQGESLFNDATALLVFGAAVGAAVSPDGAWSASLPRLAIAVPGGAALGALMGAWGLGMVHKWAGTLSAIIVQFLLTFGTWILADRLKFSPIIAVSTLAIVTARYMPARTSARDRVNAYAVWAMVVFVLNVLAFLLMGMQARRILQALQGQHLWRSLEFAAAVLVVVICVRIVWIMMYGVVLRWFRSFFTRHLPVVPVPSARIGVLASWCGMRGLVTLATAFALPAQFPGRDLIVLSAFTVVLGTLVFQGFTIRPLIALLRIAPDHSFHDELSNARVAMLDAALLALANESSEAGRAVRAEYDAVRAEHAAVIAASTDRQQRRSSFDGIRLAAVEAQRRLLIEWRRQGRIEDDVYHRLEEELDRAELSATGPALDDGAAGQNPPYA